jgi:hypothetical protein
MPCPSALSYALEGVEGCGDWRAAVAGEIGGLDVPDAGAPEERTDHDLVGVDDDVEVISEGDAAAGGGQRLGLDGSTSSPATG